MYGRGGERKSSSVPGSQEPDTRPTMEGPKPAQTAGTTQVADSPSAAQAPPPPPPPPTSSAQPPKSNKRRLDGNVQIENSKYFNMRLVLKDLRPHFLEVLRTPDFRNCKATEEVRKKMKLMIELYQQMTGQTTKNDNPPKGQSLPNGNGINQTLQDQKHCAKPAQGVKTSETWSFQAGTVLEKPQPNGVDKAGSYVVGGSAFGWNFITWGGSEPVYYGVTKEAFRSSHPRL